MLYLRCYNARQYTQETRRVLAPSVFENTYFTFFSDFKKHDFLSFFEMTFQKVVKIHSQSSLLNVYRNFGLNSRMLWVHALISHTQFSVA